MNRRLPEVQSFLSGKNMQIPSKDCSDIFRQSLSYCFELFPAGSVQVQEGPYYLLSVLLRAGLSRCSGQAMKHTVPELVCRQALHTKQEKERGKTLR